MCDLIILKEHNDTIEKINIKNQLTKNINSAVSTHAQPSCVSSKANKQRIPQKIVLQTDQITHLQQNIHTLKWVNYNNISNSSYVYIYRSYIHVSGARLPTTSSNSNWYNSKINYSEISHAAWY